MEFRIADSLAGELKRQLFAEYQRHDSNFWHEQHVASPPNSLAVAFLRSSFAVL